MKKLVIAEKPSVGRDIGRVLNCGKKIDGGLEGSNYIVTWALGHLVTLADPESYHEKYKEWRIDYLPMLPDKLQLVVISQTGKQYQAVKKLIHRQDVNEIIIATDAGREGELVARWILLKAGSKKPIKRLWISSVTDKAIKEGFDRLKDGREYDNLYYAAVARAEADWIVGMNASRALTCKFNAQLSCGRVQTPTLAMIAAREEEIKGFQSRKYYGLTLTSERDRITFTWKNKHTGGYATFQKEELDRMAEHIKNSEMRIADVQKKSKKTYAPALYDLTELQREANKKFDFSAKETSNIMQRLYEQHKLLTYPRTDSRYLTEDIVDTLKERLSACGVGPYQKPAAQIRRGRIQANKSFVDNRKVSDHHAIIPTEQYVDLMALSSEERKIYDLVVKRFLAVLLPPYEYEQTVITGRIAEEEFIARGRVVKKAGWQEVYGEQAEEGEEGPGEQNLPDIAKGTVLKRFVMVKTEGSTKPPARFNEATLLSAMENPVKYMEKSDKEAIKTIGETGGLGTVATRADIIDKLFHSFLIEKQNKDIIITSKGRQLLALVPEELKKPEMTAELEMKLSRVSKGSLKAEVLMKEMRDYTVLLVNDIKNSNQMFRHDNLTNTKCPVCGKRMLSVKGKNARLLVCQDRECGHRETLARTSNARCPVCHKKMELMGKKEDQVFTCICGHKEKMSAFQERRKKEGRDVSKRDVANYMKKQAQEVDEPFNNPFANIKL